MINGYYVKGKAMTSSFKTFEHSKVQYEINISLNGRALIHIIYGLSYVFLRVNSTYKCWQQQQRTLLPSLNGALAIVDPIQVGDKH